LKRWSKSNPCKWHG